jgi:tellurite resistance protein TehA-like permease
MSDIVIYGLGGLMFYQAYVTIRVVRSKSHTSAQKRRQILFIWLVPFVGAAIALAGLATDRETPVRPDKDGVPQKPNNRD